MPDRSDADYALVFTPRGPAVKRIIRRYMEGANFAEIAAEINISENHARNAFRFHASDRQFEKFKARGDFS